MQTIQDNLTKHYPLTTRDLNDYGYCPRIPYWIHVRKAKLANTKKMQLGKQYHQTYVSRAKPNSKTQSDIYLSHKDLNLSGIIDLIEILSDEILLHEVKFTRKPTRIPPNHYLQLLGQAVLVEYCFGKKVKRAVITYPRGQNLPVFLPSLKEQVLSPILRTIREIIHHEQLLPPTSTSQKCPDCEFFKVCRRA